MLRRSASARVVLALVLGFVGVIAACADPPDKPPPNGGTGEPGAPLPTGQGSREGGIDSGGDGGGGTDSGGVCNDLVLGGQTLDRLGIPSEPPVARGGTIADGTYNLTDYTVYTGIGGSGGATGITARATIRITQGILDEVIELGGSGNPSTRRSTGTYGASGSTLTIAEQCPAVRGAQRQYTANDPVLLLIDTGTKEAFTFTKR